MRQEKHMGYGINHLEIKKGLALKSWALPKGSYK